MPLTHRTLFDATTSVLLCATPVVLFTLVILVIGIAMLRVVRGSASPRLQRMFSSVLRGRSIPRWLAVAIAACGALSFIGSIAVLGVVVDTVQGMIAASPVVEGVVEGLKKTSEDGREATFVVRGVRFFYSEDNWPMSFSDTRTKTGALRNGQHVRVSAMVQSPAGSLGILKLDIADPH